MKYVLIVFEAPEELHNETKIHVYGPYNEEIEAVHAGSKFPYMSRYATNVVRLHSLSEELDNPYGALENGDAPDWTI